MKQSLTGILLLVTLITFSACSNVGTNFDINLVKQIQKGKTTQAEIENMFGQPYKTGVQNAHPAWVYEFNEYRAMGADASKDLIVVFNADKTVRTHQIMATRETDAVVKQPEPVKGTVMNNYNCGACNTTFKK